MLQDHGPTEIGGPGIMSQTILLKSGVRDYVVEFAEGCVFEGLQERPLREGDPHNVLVTLKLDGNYSIEGEPRADASGGRPTIAARRCKLLGGGSGDWSIIAFR